MYVCTWRSRSGMSICTHARNRASLKREDVDGRWSWGGQHFLPMEVREDSTAGPWQRTYLVESSAETSDECSQRLVTRTKKAKRSVHRRSQESKKTTRKSSKVESTYWKVFTSQVLFF